MCFRRTPLILLSARRPGAAGGVIDGFVPKLEELAGAGQGEDPR
jgi:hypothetical protein